MNQRYHALDSLRAVMMLLGVVLHSAVSYVETIKGWAYNDLQNHWIYDGVVNSIHLFRMPVFFMLSGFFAALLIQKKGRTYFFKNRFLRVALPLLIFWFLFFPNVRLGMLYANREAGHPFWEDFLPIGLADLRTMHLWFLYYLLMLYALTIMALRIHQLIPSIGRRLHYLFAGFIKSTWALPILSVVTFITLIPMRLGTLDTSAVPIPAPKILIAYVVFYLFGWFIYHNLQALEKFVTGVWKYSATALILIPLNMYFTNTFFESELSRYTMAHWATMATGAVIIWYSIAGITGLFLRYLNTYSYVARYISDASYWIYLIHLPVIIWMSGYLGSLSISVHAKFMINLLTASSVSLLSYHFLVRNTFIGLLLNGRKYTIRYPQFRKGIRMFT